MRALRRTIPLILFLCTSCFLLESKARIQEVRVLILGLDDPSSIPVKISGQSAGETKESGILHATLLARHGDVVSVDVDPPHPLIAEHVAEQVVVFGPEDTPVKPLVFEILVHRPSSIYSYIIRPQQNQGGRLLLNGRMVGEWRGRGVFEGSFRAKQGSTVELQVQELGRDPRVACAFQLGKAEGRLLGWDLRFPSESCPQEGSRARLRGLIESCGEDLGRTVLMLFLIRVKVILLLKHHGGRFRIRHLD